MRLNAQVDPEEIEITLDDTSPAFGGNVQCENRCGGRAARFRLISVQRIIYGKAQRVRARINDKPTLRLSDCLHRMHACRLCRACANRAYAVCNAIYIPIKFPLPCSFSSLFELWNKNEISAKYRTHSYKPLQHYSARKVNSTNE